MKIVSEPTNFYITSFALRVVLCNIASNDRLRCVGSGVVKGDDESVEILQNLTPKNAGNRFSMSHTFGVRPARKTKTQATPNYGGTVHGD